MMPRSRLPLPGLTGARAKEFVAANLFLETLKKNLEASKEATKQAEQDAQKAKQLADQKQKSIDNYLSSLAKQSALITSSSQAEKTAYEISSGLLVSATKDEKERATALAASADAEKSAQRVKEDAAKLAQQAGGEVAAGAGEWLENARGCFKMA